MIDEHKKKLKKLQNPTLDDHLNKITGLLSTLVNGGK